MESRTIELIELTNVQFRLGSDKKLVWEKKPSSLWVSWHTVRGQLILHHKAQNREYNQIEWAHVLYLNFLVQPLIRNFFSYGRSMKKAKFVLNRLIDCGRDMFSSDEQYEKFIEGLLCKVYCVFTVNAKLTKTQKSRSVMFLYPKSNATDMYVFPPRLRRISKVIHHFLIVLQLS